MKALYIVSLPLIVIFTILLFYFTAEYEYAYWQEWDSIYYDSYDSYGYDYTYYGTSSDEYGFQFAMVAIIFGLYMIAQDVMGLARVKTTTTKVLAIIGVSISGLVFLMSGGMAADPGAIGLNEVAPIYLIYAIIMLAFSIVGLVQAVKYSSRQKQGLA